MVKIKTIDYKKSHKCGGCNWEMGRGYYLTTAKQKEALCSDCFMDMLVANDFDVI
jgi:hypothetical protein